MSTTDDDDDMEGNTHETPKAQRCRRDPRSSPTFTNFGESGAILQHQLNAQGAIATNNAILNTVKILTNEVKQLKDLVTTLVTATTSLKNQNNDLKQGQTHLEQQIQRMGRTQREPAKNTTTTTPATSANTQPVNPQRTLKPAPTQTQTQSAPNANPLPQQPAKTGTWAKVARKGHEEKEKITGPPKKTERTIVVHRNSGNASSVTTTVKEKTTPNFSPSFFLIG